MILKIKFFATIRIDTKIKAIELDLEESQITVTQMLEYVSAEIDFDFIEKLTDKGKIIPGVIILINGKNIHHLNKLETIIDSNADISVFPAAAGG